MNQESSNSGAFTLVEILVVIGLIAIMGVVITEVFFRSLRGSNKAQMLSIIKQNGQTALDKMDKSIRNADNVICPPILSGPTSPPSIGLVIVKAGKYTRYRFVEPTTTTVNGSIKQDTPTKQNFPGSSPPREETDSEFINRVCNISDPMAQEDTITDDNTRTGVSVVDGSFRRNRQRGFKDIVSISFTLKPGVEAQGAIARGIDPVSFTTTVELR